MPSLTQAREMAALTPEQQQEIAAHVNFSQISVRELKTRIDEVRGVKERTTVQRFPGMPKYEAACAAVEALYAEGDPQDWDDYLRRYEVAGETVREAARSNEIEQTNELGVILRVASNTELESQLAAIHLRIQRKAGRLLSELEQDMREAGLLP